MLQFATSPTGDMHIGSLRVAILNYLVAQQKNDHFLVRIEDLDLKGNIEGKDSEIMMILEKFALIHNSVFHQSEHLNLYQTLAVRLLKEERAFVCKCKDRESDGNGDNYPCSGDCENLTPENYTALKESGESFVVRVKRAKETINYYDTIQGDITALPNEIDSFIILQKDGSPTYNFASACDDMFSDISYIISESSYLSNIPKQIHIKKLLGYDNKIEYAHLPDIRDKSLSVKWLFEEGFIPDAILNYLLLLGYSKPPKEIFTLPEAIEWFDLTKISKSSIEFDIDKLRSINREHLKMMDNKTLSKLFGFADEDIGKLAKLYLEEVSTIKELESKILPIFKPKDFSGEFGEKMKIIAEAINNAPAFEKFNHFKDYIIEKTGLDDKILSQPLRELLTGAKESPEVSEIYPFIKSYILEVAS